MSIAFQATTDNGTSYADPVPVYDAFKLREQCELYRIPTDWWFPLANTVTLTCGGEPSIAHLLLSRGDVDLIQVGDDGSSSDSLSRGSFKHKILLMDQYRDAPMEIGGWGLYSARAVDPSSEETDPNTIYLVTFMDVRCIARQVRGVTEVSGALISTNMNGFNVVSPTVDSTGMSFDPDDINEFPYDADTVPSIGSSPYSWSEILDILWASSIVGLNGSTVPTGGSYPTIQPLDIRLENRPTFDVFLDLLHSSGNELHPLLDGTFRVVPIDDVYGDESTLDIYNAWLIDNGHPIRETRRFPSHFNMLFQHRNADVDMLNRNPYFAPDEVWDIDDLVSDVDDNGGWHNPSGTFGEVAIGQVGTFTTFALTAVWDAGSSPVNEADLIEFAEVVIPRYIKACLSQKTDRTYGRFINLAPSAEFGEVTWFIGPGGPCTTFRSVLTSIGVEEMPDIQLEGGGSGEDKLVAANSTDETPDYLLNKINDSTTYNALSHQLVYAELVDDVGSPKDNKVRLFTDIGVEGPEGPAGDPGPDVSEGYAIDVSGVDPRQVDFDPTEITGFADIFQFFRHRQGETGQTDPNWKSVNNYDGTKDQMWWHRSDTFRFETVTGYNTAEGNQWLVHFSGNWEWRTVDDYDDTKTQWPGHVNGDWKWRTLAQWLDGFDIELDYLGDSLRVRLLLDGVPISEDSVGLASPIIKNIADNGLRLDLTGSALENELDYLPTTIVCFEATADPVATLSDAVAVEDCVD